MTKAPLLIGTSLVLGATQLASGQLVKFTPLPDALGANDMSPDGRFVVGPYAGGGAYLWSRDTGTYTLIGGLDAAAVSDDGTVVLGSIEDPDTGDSEAGIWTAGTDTWTQIPPPPEGTGCPYFTTGYELSADGTAAVGLAWINCSGIGFLWNAGSGTIALESLANGGNRASVLSADGSLIGGFAQGSFSRTPAIWTADGAGQVLDPPNGDVVGEVFGISDDGTILLGEWDGKPFKWVEGSEIDIFNPALTGWTGTAMDIADDDTIVGFDFLVGNRRAWIRPNGGPIVGLSAYLTSLGVTGVPSTLEVCQAISTNGNIIIGHNFFTGAWMVDLCTADLDGTGDVGFSDLLVLLAAWGPCGEGACHADLDGTGDVGFSDLLVLLSGWGECP